MASTEPRSKNVKIVGAGPIGLLYVNDQSTKKPPNMRIRELAQIMLEHENIMQEFIGSPSDQDTTQGTMQFMLTKKQYKDLGSWTSKNPYKYLENNLTNSVNPPTNVMALVDHYLYKKHKQLVQSGFKFDIGSISLSVNKAPVTRARKFLKRENAKSIMGVGPGLQTFPMMEILTVLYQCYTDLSSSLDRA